MLNLSKRLPSSLTGFPTNSSDWSTKSNISVLRLLLHKGKSKLLLFIEPWMLCISFSIGEFGIIFLISFISFNESILIRNGDPIAHKSC